MIRIGITGGIGSGKSMVSRLLRAMEIPVYDSDSEAKRLLVSDASVRDGLIHLVGPEIYASDGSLCKKEFASWLFGSVEHAEKANALIHPAVKRDFRRWAEGMAAAGCELCAIESAILYEAGFQDVADKVVAVSAPLEVRIARTMQRDGASREEVLHRIQCQMDEAQKIKMADFVVENGGEKLLLPQVCGIIASLLKNNT